jgi:hypothetical protein
MLKIIPAIFLFATVVMTEGATVVEEGTSGKPGMLRVQPRMLKTTPDTTSKAQKASKVCVSTCAYFILQCLNVYIEFTFRIASFYPQSVGVKKEICHFSEEALCTWTTISISENAVAQHLANHDDFDGTCDEKCLEDGGTYNPDTCTCDLDDTGCMRLLEVVNDAKNEWGRHV